MVGLLDEPVPANYRPYSLPGVGADTSALFERHVIVGNELVLLETHTTGGPDAGP